MPLVPAELIHATELLVLALPGSGCSPAIYRGLMPGAARLFAVDWSNGPGPWTPPEVARRLCKILEARTGPTVVLGHSAGCAIAMLVALTLPSHVHGLMLSNSGAHARGHGDQTLPDQINNAWTSEAQEAFLAACFLHKPIDPLWSELRSYLAKLDSTVLRDAVMGVRQLDLSADLGRILCPVQIAHGQHDARRPVHFAEELAAGIPHAELTFLPGGHTPMADCPRQYQAAFDRLIARVERSLSSIHQQNRRPT